MAKSKDSPDPGNIVMLPVKQLHLDEKNPRLPETLSGANESVILKYLYDNGAIEELAQSMADTGYFPHEPLIVLRSGKSSYIVLEGNRRFAALAILHKLPIAGSIAFSDISLPEERLNELEEVPCFEVKDRDIVHTFLGFRHIGGLKPWKPEAKARYVVQEVDALAKENAADPFKEMGRRVGSNAQGIRNAYSALTILRHAKDEFGIKVQALQDERFGVWMRALNSPAVRAHIGFGDPTTYLEIQQGLKSLDKSALSEVIADLTPSEKGQALINDSRQITSYGKILSVERARTVLRKTKSMVAAEQVVETEGLAEKIQVLVDSCEALLQQASDLEGSEEASQAADALVKTARALRAIIRASLED